MNGKKQVAGIKASLYEDGTGDTSIDASTEQLIILFAALRERHPKEFDFATELESRVSGEIRITCMDPNCNCKKNARELH